MPARADHLLFLHPLNQSLQPCLAIRRLAKFKTALLDTISSQNQTGRMTSMRYLIVLETTISRFLHG